MKLSEQLLFLFFSFFETSIAFSFPLILVANNIDVGYLATLYIIGSLTGIIVDYFVTPLLSNKNWQSLFLGTCILAATLPFSIYFGLKLHLLLIISVIIWYSYFELYEVVKQLYVFQVWKPHEYPNIWGKISLITQLGYVFAPILASLMLNLSSNGYFAYIFYLITTLFLFRRPFSKPSPQDKDATVVDTLTSTDSRRVLYVGKEVFLVLFLITFGTIITEIFEITGGLIGKALTLPSILIWIPYVSFTTAVAFGDYIASRTSPHIGKKKRSALALLGSGICLAPLFVLQNVYLVILCISFAAFLLALSLPLAQATVSDLFKRSTLERPYIVKLNRLAANIGFLLAPLIFSIVDKTFSLLQLLGIVGIGVVITSIILYLVMPKKIFMHHKQFISLSNSSTSV